MLLVRLRRTRPGPELVELGSASNGAGGGVVSIVQPIQPVIPSIPRTPRTTGISIAYVLQGSPVSEIRYTMNTIAETANIRPPYDWSLFKSSCHLSRRAMNDCIYITYSLLLSLHSLVAGTLRQQGWIGEGLDRISFDFCLEPFQKRSQGDLALLRVCSRPDRQLLGLDLFFPVNNCIRNPA